LKSIFIRLKNEILLEYKMSELKDVDSLIEALSGNVYMMIGHGSKGQFLDLGTLEYRIRKIVQCLDKDPMFLYFGDASNAEKPDIGYAFELLKRLCGGVRIVMIQIREARAWGVPAFVDSVYWHNDFTVSCKWGGIDPTTGKPGSNTKQWVDLVEKKQIKVSHLFCLGGGYITVDELRIANELLIPFTYYPMRRKYAGDGSTLTTSEDDHDILYGPVTTRLSTMH
jgi:hypothetical protein